MGASPQQLWVQAIRDEDPDTGLTSTERLVAFVLATYAAPDGRRAFPGVETIARGAGVHRSSAFRALRRLEDLGWIHVVEQGRGRRVERTLRLPDPSHRATGLTVRPVAEGARTRRTVRLGGLTGVREGSHSETRTVHEQSKNSDASDDDCVHEWPQGLKRITSGHLRGRPMCPECRRDEAAAS
jgi:hypothetical protein